MHASGTHPEKRVGAGVGAFISAEPVPSRVNGWRTGLI